MVNSFGRIFRISIYGESHGEGVGVLMDGVPAGIRITTYDFSEDLDRRKGGMINTTGRVEDDAPMFLSGIFKGRTTGAPLNIFFKNRDFNRNDYEKIRTVPRPGHSDFTAFKKFGGFNDPYGGGHFSGRLTVGIVAAGVVAKKILKGVEFYSSVTEVAGNSNVEEAITEISDSEDSFGGVVECRVMNLPAGLGEPFFDSMESLLSHLLFSIPGIKGVEFGTGFKCAELKGSENNDQFEGPEGKRMSNNAGGVEGGISNGMPLVFRIAVKPASSIPVKQKSFDMRTLKETYIITGGRHDKCIALRVPVIAEASAAIVIADLMMLENRVKRVMED